MPCYIVSELLLLFAIQCRLCLQGRELLMQLCKADLVILNLTVAGKWLDVVLHENVSCVLPLGLMVD